MKRKSIFYVAVLLFFPLASQAETNSQGHCQAAEDVVFSCSTGKKFISVCASKNLSATSGYIQYRFGPLQKPELLFPDIGSHPARYATGGTLMYSGGGGAYMRFVNGVHSYIVYSGIGNGWEKQGVAVEKNGKLLADVPCKTLSPEGFDAGFFEKAGIVEDVSGFEIPQE